MHEDNGHDGPDGVNDVLDEVEQAGDGDEVSVGDIVDEIGGDAFGPLLLVPALFLVTPVSGVPGMPTIGSAIISLIAVQILINRQSIWLPDFLRRRCMARSRVDKAMGYLRKPAAFIDRIASQRMAWMVERPFLMLPALIASCMVLAAPLFETLPFAISVYAVAVALFALAMVARDGIMVVAGLIVTAIAGWTVWTLVT